jgi:hypothetical protein
MKIIFTLISIFFFIPDSIAQDQIRLIEKSQIIEGKISKGTWSNLRVFSSDEKSYNIAYDLIDSVYVSSDGTKKKLLCFEGIRTKISNLPLSKKTNSDSMPLTLNDLSKSFQALQKDLEKSGSYLVSSGTLFLGGSLCGIVGALLAANGSPKLGVGLAIAGSGLLVIGYANLISSGNYLIKSSKTGIAAGFGSDGFGITIEF